MNRLAVIDTITANFSFLRCGGLARVTRKLSLSMAVETPPHHLVGIKQGQLVYVYFNFNVLLCFLILLFVNDYKIFISLEIYSYVVMALGMEVELIYNHGTTHGKGQFTKMRDQLHHLGSLGLGPHFKGNFPASLPNCRF